MKAKKDSVSEKETKLPATSDASTEGDSENGIWYSVAFHFFIFSIFILQNVFFDSDPIDYSSAIRVDIVGLPDKLPPEPTSPPAAEKTTEPEPPHQQSPAKKETTDKLPDKAPPSESEAIKLTKDKEKLETSEKNQKKQLEALEKIKKMSAIDKIKADLENEKKQEGLTTVAKNSFQFKGNVLNPGTELTGLNKIQHENYVATLDKKIKENWTLPQWLANKNLKAQALIKIDENGVVIYNQIYKSSGNSSYDDMVIETINKSSPFPKPPEKFVAIVGLKGILIGFPE